MQILHKSYYENLISFPLIKVQQKKRGQFSSPISHNKCVLVPVAQVQHLNLLDKNIIELETNI